MYKLDNNADDINDKKGGRNEMQKRQKEAVMRCFVIGFFMVALLFLSFAHFLPGYSKNCHVS
eukprot:4467158-Ditylum_brightwellii.AAC.1